MHGVKFTHFAFYKNCVWESKIYFVFFDNFMFNLSIFLTFWFFKNNCIFRKAKTINLKLEYLHDEIAFITFSFQKKKKKKKHYEQAKLDFSADYRFY